MKRFVPIFISFVLLVAVVVIGTDSNYENSLGEADNSTVDSVSVLKTVTENESEEMRGVWVSYLSLNISSKTDCENKFKEKFEQILKNSKQSGFNTLIIQVRPFSDALYKSSVFPVSHLLTGVQGDDIDFDPLEYMCKRCHEENLKIHAWVNPYRIKSKDSQWSLSKDNPYVVDNGLGVTYDGAIYYNPSLKSARNLITQGVREIAENYDVDGIQFDDYFYPTDDADFDKTQYNQYLKAIADKESALTLNEWRANNVNMLIADVYLAIKSANSDIEFGISPSGNIDNNSKLCADVKSWCSVKGYIDYICPQIYYSLDNPSKTFEDALSEWMSLEKHDSLKMYVGLAGYKGGTDSDSGTWLDNDDILAQELEILRENKAGGFMLYSYESLLNDENKKEIENLTKLLT